jgi:hypothetical protein
MLNHRRLRERPRLFQALTGLQVAEFDALAATVLPRFDAAEGARLNRPGRRRAIGGGHRYALLPRDQLLLVLIWLRQRPTQGALGRLSGVDAATVSRTVSRWLPLLAATGRPAVCVPDPGRRSRRGLAALLADVPGLVNMLDTSEQRTQR